jgi:hypothetical protein
MKDEDQGINVKDIIKRNIASTRKDAAGLKRPRGPEGKPPEMGSGFMQKRKDAAAKLKSSRAELARQTENFITRTVGIMVDRIEELSQGTMLSAAEKGEERAKALAKAATSAHKGGAKAAGTQLSTASQHIGQQRSRIVAGARRRAEGTPRGPVSPHVRKALGTANVYGQAAKRAVAGREDASHDFINRTVGILFNRIEEYSAQGVGRAAIGQARRGGGSTIDLDTTKVTSVPRPRGPTTVASSKTSQGNTAIGRTARSGRQQVRIIQGKRQDASHQNFIGRTVEILAEKLIGNQHKIDADGDKKITRKDFEKLRKGRKDEANKPDTSAYLAPKPNPKPGDTPIDGRGLRQSDERIKQINKGLAGFRADMAKKFPVKK